MSHRIDYSMPYDDIIIKEEPNIDRSIHFLIPALSADEPAHILSLPEAFAFQQNPLEIPLPSGRYILAPSPSELFHYYESVQPQMNSIISSSEGMIDHLTSENFIHIVENLSEYSIPCPILQNPSVDKSTSMVSLDQYGASQYSNDFNDLSDYDCGPCPSYESCYIDSMGDYVASNDHDPNLFIHHEQLMSSRFITTGDPNASSYYNHGQSNSSGSSSNGDIDCSWTSLPVCQFDSYARRTSSNESAWTKIHPNEHVAKKSKTRHSRRRTKFSNDDLEILNLFFDKNPMPSRSDISILSEKLAYPRYIVQVWFYNKRQSLKRANSSSSQLDSYSSRMLQ